MATSPIILDLSHHNLVDSFEEIAGTGIVGVILKATEGTTYIDERFAQYRDQAASAGLIVASYHFLKHGSGRQQALHYLDVVSPARGERVVIDYEDAPCTVEDLRDALQALRDAGLNLQLTVYGASKLRDDVETAGNPAWLSDTSLWAARYSSSQPSIAHAWPTWSLWQYSDKGSVSGIEGAADLNRFNGSDDNALLWLAPAGAAPAPAPEPQPQPEPDTAQVLVAITSSPPSVSVSLPSSPDIPLSLVVTLDGNMLAST